MCRAGVSCAGPSCRPCARPFNEGPADVPGWGASRRGDSRVVIRLPSMRARRMCRAGGRAVYTEAIPAAVHPSMRARRMCRAGGPTDFSVSMPWLAGLWASGGELVTPGRFRSTSVSFTVSKNANVRKGLRPCERWRRNWDRRTARGSLSPFGGDGTAVLVAVGVSLGAVGGGCPEPAARERRRRRFPGGAIPRRFEEGRPWMWAARIPKSPCLASCRPETGGTLLDFGRCHPGMPRGEACPSRPAGSDHDRLALDGAKVLPRLST